MSKSKGKLGLKILGIVLAVIVAIAAILSIVVGALWGDVITTVMSFEQLQQRNDENKEGSVYYMKVAGGFYLDKYVKEGGASSDSELISFITENLTKGLVDVSIGESDVNCSAFMAKTPSEDILFGRNYDFAKTNVCITICSNPGNGRYKSFSTVDLNYVGMDTETDVEGLMNKLTCFAAAYAPLDGMNEKGLSCGIFMSYQGNTVTETNSSGTVATDQKDESKDNFTSTTMQRMILDYCATVDEAVELISNYNLHDSAKSSFHYMIADATGKSAILEWLPENGTDATDNDGSARNLVITYNTDPMYDTLRAADDFKYQWITNFIVHDAYDYYENDEENMAGLDRYNHIYNRLNDAHGVLENEEAAMTLLSEVGRRTWAGGGGVTVHSVVYNLTDKTVRWVANENYSDLSKTYLYSFETGKLTTAA